MNTRYAVSVRIAAVAFCLAGVVALDHLLGPQQFGLPRLMLEHKKYMKYLNELDLDLAKDIDILRQQSERYRLLGQAKEQNDCDRAIRSLQEYRDSIRAKKALPLPPPSAKRLKEIEDMLRKEIDRRE